MKRTVRDSQVRSVREHLESGNSITSFDAFTLFGATRLSGIIFYLKNDGGMSIKTRNLTTKNRYGNSVRYAEYYLSEEREDES